MPGGDRTGPEGAGPRTGRQAGYCSGYPYPGRVTRGRYFRGLGLQRGFRGGRGGFFPGRGMGRGFTGGGFRQTPYIPSAEDEKSMLQASLKAFEMEMKAITDRLAELTEDE